MKTKGENIQKNRSKWGRGTGMTTWFYRDVGQMTLFDHDGERKCQNFRKSDHVVYGSPKRFRIEKSLALGLTQINHF